MRAVYFGCRVKQQVTDAIEICVKKPEYRDVKLFQVIPDPGDYKFLPVPWTGHKAIIPSEERPILDSLLAIYSAGYDNP